MNINQDYCKKNGSTAARPWFGGVCNRGEANATGLF
jgi:hypothetical protein